MPSFGESRVVCKQCAKPTLNIYARSSLDGTLTRSDAHSKEKTVPYHQFIVDAPGHVCKTQHLVSVSKLPMTSSYIPRQDFALSTDTFNETSSETHDLVEACKRRRTAGDHPLLTWLNDCELFLQELMCLEGRGDQGLDGKCGGCKSAETCYRCADCFGGVMYCKRCIIQQHTVNPLHRVKEWNGQHFKQTTLKVISHGIHEVAVDFCHCEHGKDHTRQLLWMWWFPSTSVNPWSAITFRLLEEFQLLLFKSKVSAYEFYQAHACRQDNTGFANKDRYEAFIRVVHECRGHDPLGIPGTADGDCAVLCLACPQPGKNLPNNWEFAPGARSWLYGLFIALDTNFRLKQKAVSSDEADPTLSNGWAYFVDECVYKEYLQTQMNVIQPKSSCSSHNAVNLADVKNSSGLAATGVGTVEYLQKGEHCSYSQTTKYVNMDYLFCSSLRHSPLRTLNNLWDQMTTLTLPMQIQRNDKQVKFFIPKFHLPAHIMRCQTCYLFNFIPHAPERGWANINLVASNTLNNHFGDYNWKKVCGMGTFLRCKLQKALKEHAEHKSTLEELEGAVMQDDATALSAWQTEIVHWESDLTEPNPFESKTNILTQHTVRLQLAKQDMKTFEDGDQQYISPRGNYSKHRLRVDRAELGLHAINHQEGVLLTRSSALKCKINSWARVQLLYMPMLAFKRGPWSSLTLLPEDLKLWLPSELSPSTPCSPLLCHYKWQLRLAQAHTALDSLRQALHYRSYLYEYKDANLLDARIEAALVQYQTAYNALFTLGPLIQWSSWQLGLQPLLMTDLLDGDTTGRKSLSWIWKMQGSCPLVPNIPLNTFAAVRMEWCKARAHVMHWGEEVALLLEEMRRVLEFLR
ncbi:hypothetical protein V8E55_009531 [Tylopilus felleus]